MTDFFRRYGRIILIGLLLIGLGLGVKLFETYLARGFGEHVAWHTFGLELLNHVSVALFSVAVLGFILETRHLYKYFHTLIVETIIEKQFLDDLKPDALEKIKRTCLESFFHIKQLDSDDGFYNFYLAKIEKHIGGPFRENTIAVTTVTYSTDGKSFRATDEIEYVCRKLRDRIQDSAGWTAEHDEINDLSEFEITVARLNGKPLTLGYKKGESQDPALEGYSGHGFTLSLKDYKDCDGLKIKVKAVYDVPFERPFSWTMPYLSHRFSGSIKYPEGLDLFFDSFGLDEAVLPKSKAEAINGVRTYHFEHPSWLLPDNGFSYHLRQPPAPPPPPKPPVEALPQGEVILPTAPEGELKPATETAAQALEQKPPAEPKP